MAERAERAERRSPLRREKGFEKFRGFFFHPLSDTCDYGRDDGMRHPHFIPFTIKAVDYLEACKKAANKRRPKCKKCGVEYKPNNVMN